MSAEEEAATEEAPASEEDPLMQPGKAKKRASRDFEPLPARIWDVIKVYWFLGMVCFGGPSAHVAILRDHLVRVHGWIDEDKFMELFALGQGLPGPSSTQLLISTAVTHGGFLGGVIAFIMWMLPGFIVLTISGLFLYAFVDPSNPPIWLIGIPPAAVALIFKAFYGFGLTLDKLGIGMAMISCAVAVMINGDMNIKPTSSQIVYPTLLVLGGLTTFIDFMMPNPIGEYVRPSATSEQSAEDRKLFYKIGISVYAGIFFFLSWFVTLIACTTLVNLNIGNKLFEIFETFFRIGSLIFGGGVVVLPMLENEVVPAGWVTDEQFFQGLGLAQSMPGPLFNFSAFLGATYGGLSGAFVAAAGLFGPGFVLIFAMLPAWSKTRHLAWFKAVLKGLNASAIGLIGAGCVFLYAGAVKNAADAMVFVLAGGLAAFYNVQAPFVILTGVVLGMIFSSQALNVGQKPYH